MDDDDIASASDESRITRPLRTSSDSRPRLEAGGPLLCDLIELAEVERRARITVTTADALLQEAEDWVSEYGLPDLPAVEMGGDDSFLSSGVCSDASW